MVTEKKQKYAADFDSTVCGIPCGIRVDYVFIQKPMGPMADSDWDCYGYEEVEFTVLDRTGYEAPWLQNKMSNKDIKEIKTQILEREEDE